MGVSNPLEHKYLDEGTLSLISFLTNDIVRYVPHVALIVV